MSARPLRVLLAGGGTGGHVYPGLSVVDAMRRLVGPVDVVLAGSGRPTEYKAVRGKDVRLVALPATPAPRSLRAVGNFVSTQGRALRDATHLVKTFSPDLVLGLGGFASVAPSVAACLRHLPLYLIELNAVAGKATRLLARRSRCVFVPWQVSATQLVARRVAVLGAPLRTEVLRSVPDARRRLGLPAQLPVLLIMGGSQGARALNDAVAQSVRTQAQCWRDVAILHLCGELDVASLTQAYRDSGVRAVVRPYLDDMALAYSAASLALCRAGGSTIGELLARGLPSVLVPLKHAADGHQLANAQQVVACGAGVLSDEAELLRGGAAVVRSLINDSHRLRKLAGAAAAAGRPRAASDLARILLDSCVKARAQGVDIRSRELRQRRWRGTVCG